jgi:Spc7 kinetochore protein
MDMTRAFGSILPQTNPILDQDDETQLMDLTAIFPTPRTPPSKQPTTPTSSPFINSPSPHPHPRPFQLQFDAEITRSPLSTNITGTPKRTPTKGLLALDLLTGKSPSASSSTTRRNSESNILLGSPKVISRLNSRKSIGGIEEFKQDAPTRRVSIGKETWENEKFGGNITIQLSNEGIKDMISLLTPKKVREPIKMETPSRGAYTPLSKMGEEIMLTPGMMKREFGPKVASLVKVWEDHSAEDVDDSLPGISLADFLSMTNISFLEGLGIMARRRTMPPPNLACLSSPTLSDYAKAGAVSIPMLELYQFVFAPVL